MNLERLKRADQRMVEKHAMALAKALHAEDAEGWADYYVRNLDPTKGISYDLHRQVHSGTQHEQADQ